MNQFNENGWPVEITKTELRFFHKTARSLPMAFREACKEIDQLNKDRMRLHRQLVSFAESRLAVAEALKTAAIANRPLEYEANPTITEK